MLDTLPRMVVEEILTKMIDLQAFIRIQNVLHQKKTNSKKKTVQQNGDNLPDLCVSHGYVYKGTDFG